jgi:membrane associated rhomboid family serine protease
MDRWPVTNWLLVAVTIGVFALELAFARAEGTFSVNIDAIGPFLCSGWGNPMGWFTSIFLHAGFMHIIGNMLFLWIFGNAVCSKVGNVLYLPLYIALGLAADFTHMFFDPTPALGASGAINGIVGMYLVFFPLNTITCWYFFWIFLSVRTGTFEMSGYWVVLFFLVFDIWGALTGGGMVAYWAHLGGFAAGVMVAIILLKLRLVRMERDELSLLQVVGIDKKPVQKKLTHDPADFYASEMARVDRERAEMEEEEEHLKPAVSITVPVAGAGMMKPAEDFIRFSCPCGKKIKVPIKFAGKKGKCPKCGEVVRIPAT